MKKMWIEIPSDRTLNDGIKSMLISGSRLIIVKSNSVNVLGILTEGDLLRASSDNHSQIDSLRLDLIANKNFIYVSSYEEFEKSINKFISSKILYIPVINNNRKLVDVIDVYSWICEKCGY